MRSLSIVLFTSFLCLLSACSKCYNCEQYCAYCVATNDPGLSYKFCALESNNKARVDSFYYSFPDSTFDCVKLRNEQRVCDGKNAIDEAISYYLKQDYFCNPSE